MVAAALLVLSPLGTLFSFGSPYISAAYAEEIDISQDVPQSEEVNSSQDISPREQQLTPFADLANDISRTTDTSSDAGRTQTFTSTTFVGTTSVKDSAEASPPLLTGIASLIAGCVFIALFFIARAREKREAPRRAVQQPRTSKHATSGERQE